MEVRSIPVSELLPPLYPVRRVADDGQMEELVRSIALNGLLQPLIVVSENSCYRILAGHRRYIACKGLGWQEIPCHVMEADRQQQADVTIMENLVREQVSPVDLGWYFRHLVEEEGIQQAEIARRHGHGQQWVSRHIQLTQLDDRVQEAIQEGSISPDGALVLRQIDNPEVREVYTREAIIGEKSRRQIEAEVDQYKRNQVGIDKAMEIVKAERADTNVETNPLCCEWCGKPAAERSGAMVWLCVRCIESLLEARRSQTETQE